MKRVIGIVIGLGVLALFAWTLFFLYQKSKPRPVVQQTESVVIADIVKKTVATGAIVPRQEIEIKPRVSGVVEKLHVVAGQEVKKGALIATIKLVPDMVTLNRAETSVASARISFDNAQRELARHEQLLAKGVASASELDRARLDYQLKQEELAAARDNLRLLKEGVASGKASNRVQSTVDGMVIDVPVKEGASVIESNTFNAGTTIAVVADMADMIFLGRVDESEVGNVEVGMPIQIKIGAVEETQFEGTLEYIAPKGQSVEGVIQFEIKAAIKPREGGFVRAGYSANADIVLARRSQVMAIPESALQFDEGKPFVEVEVAPQQFERRPVEVGLSDGIQIEIKSGIGKDAKLRKVLATK